MLTPFTRIMKKVMPKKSEAVVSTQLHKTKAQWTRKASAPDQVPHYQLCERNVADRVETLLHAVSGGDEVTVAAILLVALSHRGIEGVKKAPEVKLERSTNHQIADSVPAFLRHNDAKSRWSKVAPLDAGLGAATVGSVTVLPKRLDIRPKSIASYVTQGWDMRSKDTTFFPSEAKQRSDCYGLA
jgi:hypothetical protein